MRGDGVSGAAFVAVGVALVAVLDTQLCSSLIFVYTHLPSPPPGLADVPILKGQFLLRKRLLRHILKTMLLLDEERIIQRQR
jgi:hypothetical protein